VITLAKGLVGGLPIGACIASPAYSGVLIPGDHGSTFAGGPVAAAAANAVIDEVERDELLVRVREAGARLRAGLERLDLDVRGIGLMLAFTIADAPAFVARALGEQRLVLNATGPDTVRLLPPLTVSDAEIDAAVERIAALLD
jgi:acetylornithine/N-succinyldiaminopimelate aminotransferase